MADIRTVPPTADFTRRLVLEGKDGFFRQLSEGINRLLETSQKGLDDVARMLNAMSQGDLTSRIEADYAGTFGRLKNDANSTVEQLKEIVERIKGATEAINTAAQEIASGNTDLSSRTEEQPPAPGRDRLLHGAADQHGEAECGQRPHRQRATAAPSRWQ